MSKPAKTDKQNTLDLLDKDWKMATVYTAFLFPKSQQDAIRLIYKAGKGTGGRAPIINHPVNWIITAREELMDRGYLVSTDNKLRNSVIKADIEPIIQSLIAAGVVGGSTPEVIEGVRLVLDSTWFRTFFSYDNLYHPITYRNHTDYEPYRDITKIIPSRDRSDREPLERERLEITNLKNRLFQLLYEIGYYSHNIRWMMGYVNRDNSVSIAGNKDPILEDLLTSRNFDTMMETYRGVVPPRFIDIYYSCIANTRMGNMDEQFPERLIKYLLNSHAGLFIPIPVSILLRSCPCKSSVRPVDCGYILKKFMNAWRIEDGNQPT